MAKPIKAGKQAVDLAARGARVSKIRRDPPPVVKPESIEARDDRDRRLAAIGIVTFALAIVAAVIAFGSWAGWSPSQYTVQVKDGGAL